ncbi:hypothetical protein ABPG74_007805 [Tetrahymena malaccensis]
MQIGFDGVFNRLEANSQKFKINFQKKYFTKILREYQKELKDEINKSNGNQENGHEILTSVQVNKRNEKCKNIEQANFRRVLNKAAVMNKKIYCNKQNITRSNK